MVSDGAPQKARPSKRMMLLVFALAWGPGIAVGIILYLLTGVVILGGLAFMIVTAVGAVVFGAIASARTNRRAGR